MIKHVREWLYDAADIAAAASGIAIWAVMGLGSACAVAWMCKQVVMEFAK